SGPFRSKPVGNLCSRSQTPFGNAIALETPFQNYFTPSIRCGYEQKHRNEVSPASVFPNGVWEQGKIVWFDQSSPLRFYLRGHALIRVPILA
ncbi:MAG: hypothetical protein AAB354_10250, partial [candidate division KSB1 bacterium]